MGPCRRGQRTGSEGLHPPAPQHHSQNSKGPLDAWVGREDVVYVHTQLFSHEKEVLPFVMTGLDLDNIKLK